MMIIIMKLMKYIKNDFFRVMLGLFIISISILTVLRIPEGVVEELNQYDRVNILLTFFAGIGLTITGLIPILMNIIHKLLKTEGKKFIAGVIMMGMAFFIPPDSIYGVIPMFGALLIMSILLN
ncbi:hypothetical protein FMC70_19605 [Salmonella enterica subsp. enterica serovar Enteritidis]|nr:hypothetical protein [Salmonella enterica subsp. enterica serovar Enteritidis]MBD5962053.1 hypothetical protein [Salmonella enterica subsp. enterica serovar Enteritidis]MBD6123099.1 hypothetical protein [Salmonella enterica subsp. enterica serovar Enteritidis]MBD6140148.1 hypothetical protein [Salmonella enterica subsp. enterica serovar Enteritidis]MBD6150303.1 hypothetical protein [Salmonella enterica subsp. enterica serovar Enteritidis]